jgi:integrase
MARRSKGPWWWQARQQWFVTIRGKQIPLGTDEEEARRQWHILEAKASAHKAGDDNLFIALADEFLDWVKRYKKPKTFRIYRIHLQAFCAAHPEVKVAELKPHHLDTVLKEHPTWGKSTVRGFMVAVSTALNWAVKQGFTTTNPLAHRLDIPPVVSRGRNSCMSQEDYETLIANANPCLRDLLVACRNSGTRPHIVASVEARHFNEQAGCWILDEHKTDADGQPIVVHLNATLLALTKRLVQEHPTGKLFRNNLGNPWRDEVWGKALGKLRKQLAKKGIVLSSRGIMYGLRHSFATELLSSGIPEAHVAALLNHKNTVMLHKHYSHLTSKHAILKQHLDNIKPIKGEGV